MYCANCGTPRTQGVSYCNRCGADQRERSEPKTAAIGAFLTAITTIGIGGLGIMFIGSLVLGKKANLRPELIGFFMFFSFLIVAMTEIMLIRNLSKLMGGAKEQRSLPAPQPVTHELRLPQGTPLGEPVPSVTENTTRTLEYARREQ